MSPIYKADAMVGAGDVFESSWPVTGKLSLIWYSPRDGLIILPLFRSV